ncbi:MAG: DNA-processing protein DprA [Paludibacteraceae bacterium]|nr:DNA-processing protein DprA [Paludibacteraceae bacterium]MBO7233698.1 DNA-processing protein DprA [Paludibacteraceae bacterium]MBO7259337.1 DNA-processing protein DprA [Paludibacteraceae bacterium]
MNNELLYQIALDFVKGIGSTLARQLVAYTGSAEAIFKEEGKALLKIPGISEDKVRAITNPQVLRLAEEEIAFIERHHLKTYFFTEKHYPFRLKECADAPIILYGKGSLNVNEGKFVSIVGTRMPTDYGKVLTKQLVEDLAAYDPGITIVSGLAHGIDVHAHRAALQAGLNTFAIPGHALNTIYPAAHRNIAIEIIKHGGLLTEFNSKTIPDKSNFVRRNRIIAGLSDAVVVVESKKQGGSLITASFANSYSRDVFAFPGRCSDIASAGCNDLIKQNKAALIESAEDLIKQMGWEVHSTPKEGVQTQLFESLTPTELQIIEVLRKHRDGIHINELAVIINQTFSTTSSLMLAMEFKGLVRPLPGGMYKSV